MIRADDLEDVRRNYDRYQTMEHEKKVVIEAKENFMKMNTVRTKS